ncbi:MAG TPA: hypothetical protein VIM90_06160 [Arenimonas sp.]
MKFLGLIAAGHALVAALALCPGEVRAQAGSPVFSVPDRVEVEEGDVGYTDVVIAWSLSAPAAQDVAFTWYSASSELGPTPGIDYVAIPPTRVVIAAGESTGELVVRIIGDTNVESNEFVRLYFHQFEGIVGHQGDPTQTEALLRILTDDGSVAPPPTRAYDDYRQTLTNVDRYRIDVFSNDSVATQDEEGATMSLVSPPSHGGVEFVPFGHGPLAALGDYWYSPDQDFAGRDRFRYRLCNEAAECSEADVIVDVRPAEPVRAYRSDRSGFEVVPMTGLPALAGTVYEVSPLSTPQVLSFAMHGDSTPYDPWDAGSTMAWQLFTLPDAPAGDPQEYLIVTDPARYYQTGGAYFYIGVDSNGNGRPDPEELRCLQQGPAFSRYCGVPLTASGTPVHYWIAAHSRSQDYVEAGVDLYQIPLDQSDGSLVVTGPVNVGEGDLALTLFSWKDDSILPGDKRLGIVRVRSGGFVGEIPFWVANSRDWVPLPLVAGEPRTLDLAAGATRDGIFVDVPEGTTRLEVRSESAEGVDFYLAHHPGNSVPESSSIEPAPAAGQAASVSTGSGDLRTAVVEGAALAPGRWYIVPHNAGQSRTSVTLTASIQAVAPVVRSGSFFNPDRPGSGLFLYPAGNQWAGLWYTYDYSTSRPTWYYLQAGAPGANGVWKSPIYRQAWYGTQARPTQVGWAAVTPSGPDAFQFTYTLDGEVGSESYQPLGRGCPRPGGVPVDGSSHWFDPSQAGTGYSVQLWENYEFFAGFFYDAQGHPIHLTAERSGFGGASATLPLQRLTGPCPTCNYSAPVRAAAGSLTRHFSGGVLDRLAVNANYVESWPFEHRPVQWAKSDVVQPLGGPGSTQGCAP